MFSPAASIYPDFSAEHQYILRYTLTQRFVYNSLQKADRVFAIAKDDSGPNNVIRAPSVFNAFSEIFDVSFSTDFSSPCLVESLYMTSRIHSSLLIYSDC